MKKNIKSIISILAIILVGVAIAAAGSYNTTLVFADIPLFAFCVFLAFAINWIAFIPAYILQTEKFFDLTGSITYTSIAIIGLIMSPEVDLRTIIVTALIIIWAMRLGSFLFKRILKDGKDGRFDDLKPNFLSFLIVWSLQGLWVTFTLAAAMVVISSSTKLSLGIVGVIGIIVWIIGFAFEVIADTQKSKWRQKPENKGKFINSGLWKRSRHPNYFGEITLWLGVAIIAFPVMSGWQYITLISPVFVAILLIKISGIPLLQERADKKWGGQADYEEYKKNTPLLFPKLW
jgi:steroid 5-alpha reductase family enzyme